MDLRRFERFGDRQRRQDRRQPACEHRLTRARSADHQYVVAPRCRNLQRPLGPRLSLDVGEILCITVRCLRRCRCRRLRRGNRPLPAEKIHHLAERVRPDRLQPFDHSGFGRIFGRHDNAPEAVLPRPHRQRKHAPHGTQGTVEREFARQHRLPQHVVRNLLRRRQNPHGDRQIERRTLFAQVGGREVHHDLLHGHPQPGVAECGPDALLALSHRIVREADQEKTQSAPVAIDLDGHPYGVDPDDRSRKSPDKHGARNRIRKEPPRSGSRERC